MALFPGDELRMGHFSDDKTDEVFTRDGVGD